MVWNYRIVKTKVQDEIRHGIHEVYYGTGGEAIPKGIAQDELDRLGLSWTENPVTVDTFEDPKGLRDILREMLAACDKPIIDGVDYPE